MTPEPIILDPGSSGQWGWHSIQSFNECPQKFSFAHNLKVARVAKEPLVKGSLLHVGLAQHYARSWCEYNDEKPESFMRPHEAMRVVSEKPEHAPIGPKVLNDVCTTLDQYRAYYLRESVRPLHVEEVFETEIQGYKYTQRIDLVYADPQGRVWFVDHKTTGKMEQKTILGYGMSGQILGMRLLGQRHFGKDFGGVKLNMIVWGQSGKSASFHRIDPEPAPFAQSQFENVVAGARRRIDELRADGRGPWEWPKALSEQTCVGRYGACEFYEQCRWGQ
jgi:hypothetical protein